MRSGRSSDLATVHAQSAGIPESTDLQHPKRQALDHIADRGTAHGFRVIR